jgi:hypothetical protein
VVALSGELVTGGLKNPGQSNQTSTAQPDGLCKSSGAKESVRQREEPALNGSRRIEVQACTVRLKGVP